MSEKLAKSLADVGIKNVELEKILTDGVPSNEYISLVRKLTGKTQFMI